MSPTTPTTAWTRCPAWTRPPNTCADRTAGATYVALLIVLLPDGGYTLANIVRFDLPAAGGQ